MSPACTLGERIRALREAKNLSRYAVAKRACMPPTQYSIIEKGTNRNPGVFTVLRIADALGVALAEITDGCSPTKERQFMISLPTDIDSARLAFAAIKAVTDNFGYTAHYQYINPDQTIYLDRSNGGHTGAILCHHDTNGQARWSMAVQFESGDFELRDDSGTPQGRLVSTGNIHTGVFQAA